LEATQFQSVFVVAEEGQTPFRTGSNSLVVGSIDQLSIRTIRKCLQYVAINRLTNEPHGAIAQRKLGATGMQTAKAADIGSTVGLAWDNQGQL
jgi:hypothetical protein